ncbi:MAG: phasin family protein [Paracoccaceae bacterium]
MTDAADTAAAAEIETVAAETQKPVTQGMEKMSKSVEDMATFNQQDMEAVSKAAEVAMKTAEDMNAEIMSWSKRSIEEGVAAAKDMAASKSVVDLVGKQADFAKFALDGMFAQMSRMNERSLAASKEAMRPMTARVTAAADMMKTYAS